ncbi:OmpA family protein [Geobacter sp. DSM 9736]|uniref:OmpA family protein n=1 Tax=Geobacter sp. DSM 9736 TaxID=1277350 RepID=UPI000B5030F9|nr:OmpA family protein [Geobacter sp. DSM 9736]SNB45612.1 Outer membrane protein OmpA [Geobacter sp. DSM 9736]
MKHLFTIITLFILMVQAVFSHANPTETGSTGLITVPSADTLSSGNVCIGVWGDVSTTDGNRIGTVPVGLTLGLGTFWELYGSYPNLLLNGEETASAKGSAGLGTKLRFYGKSNSPLKIAADLFGERTVSDIPQQDGLTTLGARLIASLRADVLGLHLYGGYRFPDAPPGMSYDDEILYGAGLEYAITSRSKLVLEIIGNTNRDPSRDNLLEGTAGLQYYLSPHLTLNLAGGYGFTSSSPEWRAIIGLTTCQGIGTYIRPIPQLTKGPGSKKEPEVVKPVKIILLTPLLMNAATPAAPVSKLEVPVDADQEEIYIRPTAQVVIPPLPGATLPVQPLHAPSPPSQEPSRKEAQPTAPEEKGADQEADAPPGEGESPLYSVDVKGDKLDIAIVKSPAPAEKMKVYRKFRFPDITSEPNQLELSAEVKKSLSEVAELLRSDKQWAVIRVDAHTDGVGSAAYNMDLSMKRAIAIASYLTINEGLDHTKIFIKGMGKTRLISDNATSTGRKANRRFEILLLAPRKAS